MSLKQVSGGPSPAAIAETRTNAKAASGVSGKYAVVDGSDQANNEFPYVPFAPDSYDDTAMYKNKFADAAAVGGNWVVPFTEQDANYLKRQRDQLENADFDRWVMQKYDLNDPAQLFLFQQIAPEQFQRRMDLIDYEQNLVSKYAKLRLLGAKSLEDLKFEWLIETQRIELPQGPIWDPVQWMQNQYAGGPAARPGDQDAWAQAGVNNRTRFMSGLFSPLKYLTENQVGWKPNPSNRSDIRGNSAQRTRGQYYEGSNRPNSSMYYGGNPIVSNVDVSYDADTYGAIAGGRAGGYIAGGAGARAANVQYGYGRDPLYPQAVANIFGPGAPGIAPVYGLPAGPDNDPGRAARRAVFGRAPRPRP